jgi:hypothetical protein
LKITAATFSVMGASRIYLWRILKKIIKKSQMIFFFRIFPFQNITSTDEFIFPATIYQSQY